MHGLRLLVFSAAIVLGATWAEPAEKPPSEKPAVGLFDTLRPLPGIVPGETLQNAPGWQQVPEGKAGHRLQGDAVLHNGRIAVVLRKGSPGAEVYSHSPEGWRPQAVLVPCGPEPAGKLVSVKPVASDGDTVAVEAAFESADRKPLGLACELRAQRTFLKTEPRGATTRLRVEAASRFGVIPDFYADDIILDAAKIPVPRVYVPSENMLAELLGAGGVLAVTLWDGPPRDVELTLTGDGESRRIDGVEIDYARRGKAYLALLDSPGAGYAGMLGGLPDRTEPIAGYKLAKPVKRLDWQMPFPAQWRVDFVAEKEDAGQVRSREMSAPYPYPVKDGKCQGFRFIKPSFVWDWAGGTNTEMSGTPDKYPSWVDFEGRGYVRPEAASYAVLVYPFDRGRGTPLEALTLTDLVRQTLGVGPCQYVLDADRRMAQTPGIFTCGGTDMLKKMEGRMTQNRAKAEKLIEDMLVFVTAYRRRVDQYIAFRQELLAYLKAQQEQHPGAKPLIGRMKSLVEGIPAQVSQDFPKIVEQLNVEYRATLDSDDEAARKKREKLHPRYTGAGGAQDDVLAKCHQVARLLRYQAGLTRSTDPASAEIALEVRRRASAVLQNPMYHETMNRHRVEGR